MKTNRVEGRVEEESALDRKMDLKIDPVLQSTLQDFRLSVQAWSAEAYARPRLALAAAPRIRLWKLAAGWALGVTLLAGSISGGVYQRKLRIAQQQQAAIRLAEQKKAEDAQKYREEEELLARVDTDVARETPSAMEPLAQLMAEDENQ